MAKIASPAKSARTQHDRKRKVCYRDETSMARIKSNIGLKGTSALEDQLATRVGLRF